MAEIAADAGVSVETVYKNFVRKPGLLKAVFDLSVAGDDEPVPMAEREFAQAIRADPDPRSKLARFAAHMAESMPRAAPVYLLSRAAAASEPEIAALLAGWREDQLQGLTGLARGFAAAGYLRPGLSLERARDLLWTINSPEVYELLAVERGWDAAQYEEFLARSMIAALLD